MSTMTAWINNWGDLGDVFEFSTPVDLGAALVGGLIAIAVVFATDWARQPVVNHLGFRRRALPIGPFYYDSNAAHRELVQAAQARLAEARQLRKQAERDAARASGRLDRVRRDY